MDQMHVPYFAPPPPPLPSVLIAEANLRPNEIQDLADARSELTTAPIDNNLKFHLRNELSGDIQPQNEVIGKTKTYRKKYLITWNFNGHLS